MIIANGNIFCDDCKFHHGNVRIYEDRITEINYDNSICHNGEAILDADGLYVIPGLVDIHLHAAAGCDFCDGTENAFQIIADYEISQGVTSIIPSTMTLPKDKLQTIMTELSRYAMKNTFIKGVTMEGPFISAAKKGAQNEKYVCKPDIQLFKDLQKSANGLIKQVTVAPEIEGAMEFIKEISNDCVVSVAHTGADYETASAAFCMGANHVTHLYNAMTPYNHREPGVTGAAFDNKNVFVEVICDGVHVHPSMVRATFQMFGADRICMISDSMSATGMCDGEYFLGGQSITRKGSCAILSEGTLAGAVSSLYDNFKKAVLEMNIPLESAVTACTSTPARSLKLEQECGVLAVGRKADIVLLDTDLNIKYVIKDGIIRT